jgi:hypothetical protein
VNNAYSKLGINFGQFFLNSPMQKARSRDYSRTQIGMVHGASGLCKCGSTIEIDYRRKQLSGPSTLYH